MYLRYLFLLLIISSSFSDYPGGRLLSHTVSAPPNLHDVPADQDLEIIRARIVDDLLQEKVVEEEVRKLMGSLREDGTWPGINYIDTSRTGFEHRIHLENMLTLARALKKPGNPFHGSAQVKASVSKALDYWLMNDFICANWWWNEMGTPQWMINLLLVMDTDITEKQRIAGMKIAKRARLDGFGARPGGDLLPIAGMIGKQALFIRDVPQLEKVVEIIASEIKVTTGRGIKPDLSFHHRTDNVISTQTYGTSFANSFAYWAVKISGTRFKLPEEAVKLLTDYYLDGICRSLVYGIYPDPAAKNRDMTRKNALARQGTELPANLMKISGYRKKELEEIIRLRKGLVKPNTSNNRFFWHSSYLVHQRPSYFASVRMHSSRSSNMEQPHNEEGLRMHHFGDGSNFISRRGDEYMNIYPVWNWQMVPGTTVLQKPEFPHWKELAKKGKSEFSGGLSDGRYGLAAIDLISVHDPLKAKKAWFFFDDEYFCLGSDINAEKELPVFTTINQCLLKTTVLANSQGKTNTLNPGEHQLSGLSWLMHDSVAYVFPEPVTLNVTNGPATGSWRQINHQSWATDEPVTMDVLKIWLDHGKAAAKSAYAYKIFPAVTEASLATRLKNSDLQAISNTAALQAVYHSKLRILQSAFYQPGSLSAKGVTVIADQRCLLMLKTDSKGRFSLTVADPTQRLDILRVYIDKKLSSVTPGVKLSWEKNQNRTLVEIKMPRDGMAGKSVNVALSPGKQ